MRRRGVLSLPVVVAAGAVGCSRSGGSGPVVSGSGEASGSGTVDAGGGGSASASDEHRAALGEAESDVSGG